MKIVIRCTLALAALVLTLIGYPTAQGDTAPVQLAVVATINYQAADAAALATLAGEYNWQTGLWPIGTSGWWSSANDLTALIDGSRALGTHQYDRLIGQTYALDLNYTGPDFRNNGPNFTNHYYDDTLWWGLTWLDAYQWTGDQRYLRTAETDNAYAHQARAASVCGDGIPWAVPQIQNGDQPNAITNSLAMELAAKLAVVTGRSSYLREAQADWSWLQRSDLIGTDGLVRDHLDAACRPTGPAWSYNQGTLAAALAAMANATGLHSYLDTALRLAVESTGDESLSPHGTLRDVCEPMGTCAADGAAFKGAAVRGWGQLNAALPDRPLNAYLDRQATAAITHDQAVDALYGLSWGAAPAIINTSTQAAAVDLLNTTLEK